MWMEVQSYLLGFGLWLCLKGIVPNSPDYEIPFSWIPRKMPSPKNSKPNFSFSPWMNFFRSLRPVKPVRRKPHVWRHGHDLDRICLPTWQAIYGGAIHGGQDDVMIKRPNWKKHAPPIWIIFAGRGWKYKMFETTTWLCWVSMNGFLRMLSRLSSLQYIWGFYYSIIWGLQ